MLSVDNYILLTVKHFFKYYVEKVDNQSPKYLPVFFRIQEELIWYVRGYSLSLLVRLPWLFSCTQKCKTGKKKHKHQTQWIEQSSFENEYDQDYYHLASLQVQKRI